MSKLNLYYLGGSPSSRSVKYLAELLRIDINICDVNIRTDEQKSEKYLKLNPAQTIPVLEDDGIKIFDSHAIMIYLVEKYADSDDLYPKDLVQRAKVNSALFFEAQFIFGRMRAAIEPVYYDGKSEWYDHLFDKVLDTLLRFERILSQGHDFVAGDTMTIADISCLPSVAGMESFLHFDEELYPNITKWRNMMFDKYPDIERSEDLIANDLKILIEQIIEMRKWMEPGAEAEEQKDEEDEEEELEEEPGK